MVIFFAVSFIAYLMGAFPSGVVIARLLGIADPRSYGSGNIGATNVARGGNRLAAILTLFSDAGKAAAAVLVAGAIAPAESATTATAAATALAGAFAVAGHVSSPFLRFRGGRGVACALAVYVSWQPALGGAVLLVWAAVFALFRYSSLASLVATTAASALFFFFAPMPVFFAALAINALIIARHTDNIRRLVAGEEQGFRR